MNCRITKSGFSRVATLALASLLLFAVIVRADEFQLVTGGVLTGDLLNPDESPRRQYVIKTVSGRLVLEAKQVVRVNLKSEALKEYEKVVATIENSAEAHWQMAQRCALAELWPQRDDHLQQVIRLDPGHELARQKLGYVRIDGQWQQTDVWMRKQGYVKHKKRWRLPQEIAAELTAEKRLKESVELKTQIQRWRTAITKGRVGSSDAMRALKGIENQLATPILAELLEKKNEPRILKLVYVDVLSKLGGGVAEQALVERVMNDADERIQEVCLEQLRDWKSRRAIVFFVSKLNSSNNAEINLAGYALGQIGHGDAIVPLIDALTSKHKLQIGSGNQINAGFSPGGSGGLGFGGRPKIIEQEMLNKRVHGALLVLVPEGVNYGFNKNAWKDWYAKANTPRNVSLRRRD